MSHTTDLSSLTGLPPEAFASAVFNRYAERLLVVAKDRLGARLRAKVGPEDVVNSAFKSFFRRRDEFQFDDADGLWGLLVVITMRKCVKWANVFSAEKRSAGREQSLLVEQSTGGGWMDVAGHGPAPEDAVAFAELVEQFLGRFNARQQEMLSLRMQGFELDEIAQQVKSSRRTVDRVMAEAKAWLTTLLESKSDAAT